jgi:hypothetical protein
MRKNHVVLSTEQIANNLRREKSNIYSSREQLEIAAKLMSGDMQILLLQYDGSADGNTLNSMLLTMYRSSTKAGDELHLGLCRVSISAYASRGVGPYTS